MNDGTVNQDTLVISSSNVTQSNASPSADPAMTISAAIDEICRILSLEEKIIPSAIISDAPPEVILATIASSPAEYKKLLLFIANTASQMTSPKLPSAGEDAQGPKDDNRHGTVGQSQAVGVRGSRNKDLSQREKQILAYIVEGLSNVSIAKELGVAVGTVKVHVKGLMIKMQVSNRTQAALKVVSKEVGALDDHQIGSLNRGQKLSDKETDVLRWLVTGISSKMIARKLDMSEPTVKVHLRSLMNKMRVNNRTQAAVAVCRGTWGTTEFRQSLFRAEPAKENRITGDAVPGQL